MGGKFVKDARALIRTVILIWLLTVVVIRESAIAAAVAVPPTTDSVAKARGILDRYRQVLLITDEARHARGNAGTQALNAARLMFYDGLRQRERYSKLLTAEVRGTSPAADAESLPAVSAFVGFLERDRVVQGAEPPGVPGGPG